MAASSIGPAPAQERARRACLGGRSRTNEPRSGRPGKACGNVSTAPGFSRKAAVSSPHPKSLRTGTGGGGASDLDAFFEHDGPEQGLSRQGTSGGEPIGSARSARICNSNRPAVSWVDVEVRKADRPHPALASLTKPQAQTTTARSRLSQRHADRVAGEKSIGSGTPNHTRFAKDFPPLEHEPSSDCNRRSWVDGRNGFERWQPSLCPPRPVAGPIQFKAEDEEFARNCQRSRLPLESGLDPVLITDPELARWPPKPASSRPAKPRS
jgi:hypothetical protein